MTVPSRLKGFTLIEVMLAMAITVFVAVIAYQGLTSATSAAEVHEAQAQRLAEIQTALTVIERDIRHIAFRGIVNPYGDSEAALIGGATEDYPLRFTRLGWDNPRGQPRGEIQRVRYLMDGEQMWRESWSVLDLVNEEEGQQRLLLLAGVKSLELRFLNDLSTSAALSPIGGEWQDSWDPPPTDDQLPRAIEISLDIEKFGLVTRVFAIAHP